jgi:hypothetical protein
LPPFPPRLLLADFASPFECGPDLNVVKGGFFRVVCQFDCNRLSSYFFGDGRFPLVLTTATDDPSFVMMYFVVIVTVPSLLLVPVRSVPLIRGLLHLAD